MRFWGFDLGDGESAVAVTEEGSRSLPEIREIDGQKVVVTAWALMSDGSVRIGEHAERAAASAMRSAVRFKGRFLDPASDSAGLIRDFSSRVLESLRESSALQGGDSMNRFSIGCPAGWESDTRERYLRIFRNIGCPDPRIVSESRAVMVGSVQSNSLRGHVDLRSRTVLVIDIGSSTTDLAYIERGKESEIRTGGEVRLGGGIMDEVLLETCIANAPQADALRRVLGESIPWKVDCELKARRLKERYFSASAEERASGTFEEHLLITYDEPVILPLVMNEETAEILLERSCSQLGGRSFREVFREGLRTARDSIGGTQPELVFLTGGVSRIDRIRDWCLEVFPEAAVFTDREPEYSVARGLAWCGRIDDELRCFREEVDGLIRAETVENIISEHLNELYDSAMDSLLDPILEHAVRPVLTRWRDGEIRRLSDMEKELREKVRIYLYSENARTCLYRPVKEWMKMVSGHLEEVTSPICRKYHVPDHTLEISSSLTAGDLSVLENIETKEIFASDAFTGTVLVESVISAIIALFCGGTGVALIAEGPMGMLIGFVISLVMLGLAHAVGKSALDKKLMDADLPLFLRRAALNHSLPRLRLRRKDLLKRISSIGDKVRTGEGGREHRRDKEIPERRMRSIRDKISSGYKKTLEDSDNAEIRKLNGLLRRDISKQIENKLKELAEQVELPLQ